MDPILRTLRGHDSPVKIAWKNRGEAYLITSDSGPVWESPAGSGRLYWGAGDHWVSIDGSVVEGQGLYDVTSYFDADGTYLGPDDFGVYPNFQP